MVASDDVSRPVSGAADSDSAVAGVCISPGGVIGAQAEEELAQQRKSVAENGPHQQPSIQSRVPRLAGCLGYQQARMTGCALQGVIFIPFAMLGAYRVVRAEGEPLGCAIKQFADTLRHAAQTAERALPPAVEV